MFRFDMNVMFSVKFDVLYVLGYWARARHDTNGLAMPPAWPDPINSGRAVPEQYFWPTCQPGPARDTGVP